MKGSDPSTDFIGLVNATQVETRRGAKSKRIAGYSIILLVGKRWGVATYLRRNLKVPSCERVKLLTRVVY
jgi:hypothetical protein